MTTTQELPLTVIPVELAKAVAETGLTSESAQSVCRSFAPHYISATQLLEEAKTIAVNAPIAAKAMRLKLKVVRCAAEATRVSLNAEAQQKTRSINAINALIEKRIAAEEDRLDRIEKAEAIAAAEKRAALKKEREAAVIPYGVDVSFLMGIDVMPEPQWQQYLSNAKAGHEARIAAAAKAEADRLEGIRLQALRVERDAKLKEFGAFVSDSQLMSDDAFNGFLANAKAARDAFLKAKADKEAADAAERERLRVENERLAKVAAEERAARAEAEKVAAAKLKKAQDAAKKEREAAAELQRIENEKHAKAHAEFQEKARIERERVETAAAAERKKQDDARRAAEAEAEKQRLARKKIEDEQAAANLAEYQRKSFALEAARKAAAAPDREKVKALAVAVRSLSIPELSTSEELAAKIQVQVEKFAQWLETEAARL